MLKRIVVTGGDGRFAQALKKTKSVKFFNALEMFKITFEIFVFFNDF